MALEYKRNAIIVCHEANDIKTSMEKKMKSAMPADDDANDSERETWKRMRNRGSMNIVPVLSTDYRTK